MTTIDGTSWGHPNVQDDDTAAGLRVTVATQTAGQIIVRESGGSTLVYEQGSTVDSFTVALVSAPAAAVYVNVSAAASPSEAAAMGARTVLVSIDGGVTWLFAAVLTFAPGDMGPKTVLVKAIDDPAAEGPLNAVLSLSSQSADPVYNHAEIRNVLAQVIDNDQAGLVIVQSDGNTTVLQGAPPYGIVDTYTIAPTMAPALYTNVKITLFFNDDNLIVTSTDPRFDPTTRTFTFDWTNWTTPAVVTVAAGSNDPHWGSNLDDQLAEGAIFHVVTSTDPNYIAQFGSGLVMHSNGDDQWGHMQWSDGHGWIDDHGWEDQGWNQQNGWYDWYGYWDGDHGWHAFPHPVPLVDVNILRPDEDNVYIVQSNGGTLVAQGDPNGDTYTIRLTAAPTDGDNDTTVVVQLQSDGQTIASDACGCDSRFTAGTGTSGPTVTFDTTNWWIPFTVRLTSNPAAPATDPFQPLQAFPNAPDERVFETDANQGDFRLVGGIRFGEGWFDGRGWGGGPVWVDGHGWFDGSNWFDGNGWFNGYGGWWFDGDNWFDGHGWLNTSNEPSLHNLLCNDGNQGHWYHGDWNGWGWGGWGWQSSFGCEDLPARQPVILPSEQGAGAPPDVTFVSGDITAEATSAAGATVAYNPVKAHGEIGTPTITYSQSSGTIYPIGTTTVNAYLIDQGGNYTNVSFNITVQDTTAPAFTFVTPNITVEATAVGTPVFFALATASDAVGPVTITYVTQSGASVLPGSLFPIGTTTVTETATDAYGNHSSKTFKVIVQDTTAPVVSAINITVEAHAVDRRQDRVRLVHAGGHVVGCVRLGDAELLEVGRDGAAVRDHLGDGDRDGRLREPLVRHVHGDRAGSHAADDHGARRHRRGDELDRREGDVLAERDGRDGHADRLGVDRLRLDLCDRDDDGDGDCDRYAWQHRDEDVQRDGAGHDATVADGARERDGRGDWPDDAGDVRDGNGVGSGERCPVDRVLGAVGLVVPGRCDDGDGDRDGQPRELGDEVVHGDGEGHDGTGDHDGAGQRDHGGDRSDDAGDLRAARNRDGRGDGVADDHLLGAVRLRLRGRDDDGDGDGDGRRGQPLVEDVHGEDHRHDAAGRLRGEHPARGESVDRLQGCRRLVHGGGDGVGSGRPGDADLLEVGRDDPAVRDDRGDRDRDRRRGQPASATFNVTVQDTTAPVIAPLPNLTLEATSSAGAKATYTPTATDATGTPTITVTIPSGTIFPLRDDDGDRHGGRQPRQQLDASPSPSPFRT